MLLLKPNGISVLIAAQNEEKTIKLCVESFLKFADEIIIVTNGSTDNTKSICLDLEKDFAYKVKYFDKPDLPDLYNNRAFALSMAKYKWIFRGDADYIAYTDEDGINSISLLRNIILNHKALFIGWSGDLQEFEVLDQPLSNLIYSNKKLVDKKSIAEYQQTFLSSMWSQKGDILTVHWSSLAL